MHCCDENLVVYRCASTEIGLFQGVHFKNMSAYLHHKGRGLILPKQVGSHITEDIIHRRQKLNEVFFHPGCIEMTHFFNQHSRLFILFPQPFHRVTVVRKIVVSQRHDTLLHAFMPDKCLLFAHYLLCLVITKGHQ